MKQKSNISGYTICLYIGLAATLCAQNTSADDSIKNASSSISGTLKITHISDGDSMRSGKFRIRLFGVDAPEKQQQCKDKVSRNWDCGIAAKKALEELAVILHKNQINNIEIRIVGGGKSKLKIPSNFNANYLGKLSMAKLINELYLRLLTLEF